MKERSDFGSFGFPVRFSDEMPAKVAGEERREGKWRRKMEREMKYKRKGGRRMVIIKAAEKGVMWDPF